MSQTFFAPLRMSNTAYDHQTAADAAREATGYVQTPAGQLTPADYIDMTVPQGAGGFYSTVDDLGVWLDALLSDKVLSATSTARMFTPSIGDYGLGWFIQKTQGGHTAFFHSGVIDGFQNTILVDSGSRTSVVLLVLTPE
jgi:CubicO group peptidase (beta-lactamase class C family)